MTKSDTFQPQGFKQKEDPTLATLKSEFEKTASKGMPIQDFQALAKKFGFNEVRPTEINGKGQIATCDYRSDRLNVSATAPVLSTEVVKIGKREYLEEKIDHLKLTVVGISNIG